VCDPSNPDRHSYGVDELFGRQARIHILCRAFDYIISYRLGTNGWMLIPVGLVYFLIYYFLSP
jgi:phosphotransferase system  glucose/maltose/N-acetylglucosamine-specific IIC component